MEHCIVTDMENGIGNILSEIIPGLFFSKKLSEITGKNYNYYALITDKCLKGHQIIYNKEHEKMPHPLNLSGMFPKINFLARLPDNMAKFRYSNYTDPKILSVAPRIHMNVCYSRQMLLELSENMNVLEKVSFSDAITNYTLSKYSPTNKSLAIHIRLRQVGDYMKLELPDFQWYKKVVDQICSKEVPDKIFLITGSSTAEDKDSVIKNVLLSYLKSVCENVVDVVEEPYYVDMSLLSICGNKIITNSTFSLFSTFIDLTEEKKVFYPECVAKHYSVENIMLPNFQKVV